MDKVICAALRQNLSSGFLKKPVSNQTTQLKRLARKLKFTCSKFTYGTFQYNKGADQAARMCRLVCTCVVRKPPEDRVSRVAAHILGKSEKVPNSDEGWL